MKGKFSSIFDGYTILNCVDVKKLEEINGIVNGSPWVKQKIQ